MPNTLKDILGAIVVAVITMFLVIVLMGSVVLLGHSAGKAVRGSDGTTVVVPQTNAEHVSVLAYHYFRERGGPMRFLRVLGYVVLSLPLLDDTEVWTQNLGSFERQMQYLYENGYRTVTLDELTDWQAGRIELPPRSVAITFDDGDRSVYDSAYPILEKYGFTATFFLVTSKMGEQWEGVDVLFWPEVREMADSGVFRIESHTHDLHYRVESVNHPVPVFIAASKGEHQFERYRNWQSALLDDLGTSRTLIRRHIGTDSNYLAWPYGEHSDAIDWVARSAGFRRVVGMTGGTNRPVEGTSVAREPINRYGLTARTSLHAFKKMLNGTFGVDDV